MREPTKSSHNSERIIAPTLRMRITRVSIVQRRLREKVMISGQLGCINGPSKRLRIAELSSHWSQNPCSLKLKRENNLSFYL